MPLQKNKRSTSSGACEQFFSWSLTLLTKNRYINLLLLKPYFSGSGECDPTSHHVINQPCTCHAFKTFSETKYKQLSTNHVQILLSTRLSATVCGSSCIIHIYKQLKRNGK